MIPIEVTARFSRQGEIIPKDFFWQNIRYPVISTGRHWQDEKGYHILVMTPDQVVHELVFITGEMAWYLAGIGNQQLPT